MYFCIFQIRRSTVGVLQRSRYTYSFVAFLKVFWIEFSYFFVQKANLVVKKVA